jgi:glycosyltransferase involved in cell wall biosynthesis
MPRKSKSPLVTVIIPTYNRSATLSFALQSVRAQTLRDFEVLVVGDACTDDSEKVVHKFRDPRFHWINLEKNSGGQWGPNNEGLKRAQGLYIAYLGHDDLWFPWHLSSLMTFVAKTGADLAYTLTALFGPEGRISFIGPLGGLRTFERAWVPPSSWLHRRGLTNEIGNWRAHSQLLLPTDCEFLQRAYRSNKKIKFCKDLSVLKFPAAWWRMYALNGDYPQFGYVEKLRSDPRALYTDLLREGACGFLQHDTPIVSVRESLLALIRTIGFHFLNVYGIDRWPVAPMYRWRSQRSMKKIRQRRGL